MFEGLEEEFDESFSFDELDTPPTEDTQDEFIQDQLTDEDVEESEETNSEEETQDEESEETTEESTEESDEDDEPSFTPFIQTLEEQGLLYLDPEKEYEDSVEGFQEVIQDTITARFNEVLEGLSPTARRLLEVEQNGGNIEEAFEVFNSFDYSQVDINDTDIQREIVKEYYQNINPRWSEEKINKKIDSLDSTDDLFEEAEDAKQFFVDKKAADEQAYLQQTKAQREAQELAYQQEMNEYQNIIDSNEALAGLPFTSKMEKEAFKKYCFEVGEDGKTQAERDDDDKTTRITKEFYKFKKFQFADVEKKAKTKAVVDMKKQLSHFGRKAPGTTKSQEKRKNTDGLFTIGDLNFDIG